LLLATNNSGGAWNLSCFILWTRRSAFLSGPDNLTVVRKLAQNRYGYFAIVKNLRVFLKRHIISGDNHGGCFVTFLESMKDQLPVLSGERQPSSAVF
jgi:hypothetical protein